MKLYLIIGEFGHLSKKSKKLTSPVAIYIYPCVGPVVEADGVPAGAGRHPREVDPEATAGVLGHDLLALPDAGGGKSDRKASTLDEITCSYERLDYKE